MAKQKKKAPKLAVVRKLLKLAGVVIRAGRLYRLTFKTGLAGIFEGGALTKSRHFADSDVERAVEVVGPEATKGE